MIIYNLKTLLRLEQEGVVEEVFSAPGQTHDECVNLGRRLETRRGENLGRFGGQDYKKSAIGRATGGVFRVRDAINGIVHYRYFRVIKGNDL